MIKHRFDPIAVLAKSKACDACGNGARTPRTFAILAGSSGCDLFYCASCGRGLPSFLFYGVVLTFATPESELSK